LIVGGPALFLVGHGFFQYALFGRAPWNKLVGVLVLALIAPALILLPPLGVVIAAAVVLAGIAVVGTRRESQRF
jgi:low temperature requirement protein LtrA